MSNGFISGDTLNTNTMENDQINFNFQENPQDKEDEKLIEDRKKLDTDWIPERIRYRDQQINNLAENVFSKVANGKEALDTIVYGPPGTGKTSTVKFMKKQTEKENDTSNFRIEYINCKDNSSAQGVFKELSHRFDSKFKRGVSIGDNAKRLKRKFTELEEESVLIILDEAHELYDHRRSYLSTPVLYHLSRPTTSLDMEIMPVNINVMVVSNDTEIKDKIEEDVASSMEGPQDIQFPEYTEDEIVSIIDSRQRKAYTEEVLSSTALRKVAKEVSNNFDGDVRQGISILKKIPDFSDDVMTLKDDRSRQIEIVDDIIVDLQRNKINSVLYAEDDDFYIVMSAFYQQIVQDKARLKYITESYDRACEIAMREKKGTDWNTRKNYVYRQMEKLVDQGLVTKTKNHREMSKPSRYEPNFDPELFRDMVNDMLERKGLLKRLKSKEYSVSEMDRDRRAKSELEKEAEEKMDELMEG